MRTVQGTGMKTGWSTQIEPIPALQWLVVIILSVHLLHSGEAILNIQQTAIFIVSLFGVNAFLLHVLPNLIHLQSAAGVLVIADSILVPTTLFVSGTTRSDVFIVYFGIIMIAASAKTLKEALILTLITCSAYIGFSLYGTEEAQPVEVVLLRIPLFLIMTLFYGAMSEYAHRERREKDKLAYAAMHDELTGMPNRRFIMETLSREMEEAKRFATPVSCAIMDIDDFKDINDSYGHGMGDLLLKHYGSLLRSQSRVYDVPGRLGGDEFVWILPRAGAEDGVLAADRFRQAVQKFDFQCGDRIVSVTTSIGVTTYRPSDGMELGPAQMLKAADVALYEAKKQGRNRVYHFAMGTSPKVALDEATPQPSAT